MEKIFDVRIIGVLALAAIGAFIGVLLEPYGTVCIDWLLYCFESGTKGSILGAAFVGAGLGAILAWNLLYGSTDRKR